MLSAAVLWTTTLSCGSTQKKTGSTPLIWKRGRGIGRMRMAHGFGTTCWKMDSTSRKVAGRSRIELKEIGWEFGDSAVTQRFGAPAPVLRIGADEFALEFPCGMGQQAV